MILEGIITCLSTDFGCLKPEMAVQTTIEGFKQPKEVLKQVGNADQNYLIIVNNT